MSDVRPLIPQPESVAWTTGAFRLTADTAVQADNPQHPAVALLLERLRRVTGYALPVASTGQIRWQIDPSADLGDEGYQLVADPDAVSVVVSNPGGWFWAAQTMRQLLPEAVEAGRQVAGAAWDIPAVRIVDGPRFCWRGGHLDVARHFFDVDYVKRYIDRLALHKQNVFHWHLTDDQGWRLQIERYPGLTDVGAWRTRIDGTHHGGSYTQADARQVVAYAADRGITVVPEIELPGHALAALAAYPELSCTGGSFSVTNDWGVFDDVFCVGNDDTIRFLEYVFDEVLDIFPSQFIHVGGDECPKARWRECERCQQRIKQHDLADEEALQSWTIRHFDRYLADRGRRLVGWDEILEGGLAPGATVMSWRGVEGGLDAARQGHDVVMAPQTHVYLDRKHYEGDDEPGRLSVATLRDCYGFDPIQSDMTPDEQAHVLGVQANVWSEGFDTAAGADRMIWPRMAAVAEMAWTPSHRREYGDFVARVRDYAPRLEALGIAYYRDTDIWPD